MRYVLVSVAALSCNGQSGGQSGSERAAVRSSDQFTVTGNNGQGSGVPECDAYLNAYEACINRVVTDGARRLEALQGLNTNAADWHALADDSAKKTALAQMCANAQRLLDPESCGWSAGAGGSGSGGGGSGGGGSGGGTCTASTATPITVGIGVAVTVAGNACFRIKADTTRDDTIKLQSEPVTAHPLNFTYRQNSGADCGIQGAQRSGTFVADHAAVITPGTGTFNRTCPVVYQLSGAANANLKFKYWYQ